MRYYVNVDGRTLEVDLSGATPAVDGEEFPTELTAVPGSPVRSLLVRGRSYAIVADAGDRPGSWTLRVGGRTYEIEVIDERTRAIHEMTGGAEVATARSLTAPMPGLVLRVEVQVGSSVRAGQGLVVVEAMKMENELKAPADGVVAEISVEPGQTVEKGATLVVLE